MSKITWDKKTGGVKLSSYITDETLKISPRPVFYEELDLLKLSNIGWKYPKSNEPLLWACNKKYFYFGEFVFEVNGANIYDNPCVIFQPGFEKTNLIPVDVNAMLEINKDILFLLESEAIEFIREIYQQYSNANLVTKNFKSNQLDYEKLATSIEKKTKQKMAIIKQDCDSFDIMPLNSANQEGIKTYQTTKIDKFLASFSGGKDSQVLLDLCVRAIPPSEFEVIYSDTGYELPTSLEIYEITKQNYGKRFPDLQFSISKNHDTILNYWDKIGTPSNTHRWCCSVMKTAPLYRMLKLGNSNQQAKVLTFDGVRSEESVRRSKYGRVGKGVKHNNVINASPILYWTTTEIFLYLFHYKLPINNAYRQGMTRVGCLICPFSSDWNDMISRNNYPKYIEPFLSRIENKVKNSGVKDINEYIKSGNWKRRAGGRDMSFPSHMEIVSTKPNLEIKCISPQKDLITWLIAVGDYTIHSTEPNITGEINYKNNIFKFTISISNNEQIVIFENTAFQPTLQGLLKRALYKATFCINCESCEVECPTGALYIMPEVKIDRKKCIHCHKCLLFHDFGCIVANSLNITGNNINNKNKSMKLISYNNFGLKEEWLDVFMSSPDTYFIENLHGLNIKYQLPNFVKWLVQAEVIDNSKSKSITPLGKILYKIYQNNPRLVWEVIWINLTYNSPIAKWYKENVDWNFSFTQVDIQEMVKNDYPSNSPTTISNIVYALFRTFKESPIGNMGLCIETEKLQYKKNANNDLSRESIAYSLYKYSEINNLKSFRVSDFYNTENNSGFYKEFGISKSDVEKHLRSLNSDTNRILIAELNMGLDHINLRDDLTSLSVLSFLNQ